MKIRSLTALLLIVPALASAQSDDDKRIREAATRGLAAIQKAQANWFTSYKQVCASCHHQYQPALAYRAARERGVPVDETIARADAVKAFTFADIDRAMELGYRHPMGPLKLTDLVGLDVRLAILEHLHREIGEQFRPPSILRQLVRAGRLGKKTGEGFYRWTESGPEPIDLQRSSR